MSAAVGAPQTNGILPSETSSQTTAGPSQPPGGSQSQAQPTQSQTTARQPPTQQPGAPAPASAAQPPPGAPSSAPRPRDARTIELLLTAQGVTAYEERVPQLLLDFAYRHTSAVLNDALHLSADPYTSHAGAKPSASSGAAPVTVGDAAVSANAIQLAIASRLAYQFRGGGGGGGVGGGSASKEWMQELARERNKTALPRVAPSEWGIRLPSERFVLSGVSWGLRDALAGQEDDESSEDEEGPDEVIGSSQRQGGGEAMEGVETEDVGGDPVEGGTMDDVFGEEDVDVEMEQ